MIQLYEKATTVGHTPVYITVLYEYVAFCESIEFSIHRISFTVEPSLMDTPQ